MLGAMQNASTLIADRAIFYKQMDANFFSSWPYILGRTLAGFPQVRNSVSYPMFVACSVHVLLI